MKEIPLTKGKIALVDDEDYEWLSQWKWYAAKYARNKHYYAVRAVKHRSVYMHRVIMNTPSNLVVDHIDGNALNNQRSNLRNCTQSCNTQNQDNCIGYQGVSKINNNYIGRIGKDSKSIYLGCFSTEEEAAKAYNSAALQLYGEQAKTNTQVY